MDGVEYKLRKQSELIAGIPLEIECLENLDETIDQLKEQSLLPAERFLDLLLDRVGYSSYLKDQIRNELQATGDPTTQITVLQGAIREL